MIAACEASAQSSAPATPEVIDLFEAGGDGFHTFRIPVLLASSRGRLLAFCEGRREGPASKLLHAGPSSYSSMVVLKDGTVLCLFEGGTQHRREWLRLARFPLAELLPAN